MLEYYLYSRLSVLFDNDSFISIIMYIIFQFIISYSLFNQTSVYIEIVLSVCYTESGYRSYGKVEDIVGVVFFIIQ